MPPPIDLLILLTGVALLAVTALAVTSTLRIPGRAPFWAAALVTAAATVVLLLEALSVVEEVTRPAVLIGHAALAAAATGLWLRAGRPRPPGPWRLDRPTIVGVARAHPAVAVVVSMAATAMAVQFAMAVMVAPNNYDALSYHLSRAAYWLQFESVSQFPGGHGRQLVSPPNAEILQAWMMLLSGGDRFVQLVQWAALAGLVPLVFSAARLLRFPAPASAFAAALFVAMPQPLMQASSAQNDLVVSFFLVAAGLFGVRGLRDRRGGDLAVSAAAVGLAVGAKATALVAGPSLILVLLAAVVGFRPPARLVIRGLAGGVAGIALLGAYNYVLTFRNTGTLFGGVRELVDRDTGVLGNGIRLAWTLVDAPALSVPWFDLLLQRPAQALFADLQVPGPYGFAFAVDMSVQEDLSAYGPLGFLFLVPVLLVTALRPASPFDRRVVALAALGYLALFAVLLTWNIWIGRVMMPFAAFGAPLLAALFSRAWLRPLVVLAAVLGLAPSLLLNQQKRLLVGNGGTPPIFRYDRIGQQTQTKPQMAPALRRLEQALPRNAALGFVGTGDAWDYPLFGSRLERRVVPRLKPEEITPAFMARERLEGAFFAEVAPPTSLRAVELAPGYWLARPGSP